MDEKKYSQLYQALLQEVLQFHSGNQRRIRKGMLSLLLVPLAFLVLLGLPVMAIYENGQMIDSVVKDDATAESIEAMILKHC